MLAIRLQRTGRSGHAQFRIIVQDAHKSPTSGNVVQQLGNYNPHSKEVKINKEKTEFFLSNGAQPSDRVIFLLKKEGIKMPSWVNQKASKNKKDIKNTEKLRRNRPAEKETVKTSEATATVEEPVPAAPEAVIPEEKPAVEEVVTTEPAPSDETATEVKEPAVGAEEAKTEE